MRHPVCNQQICENLFHYLPSSVYVIYRFVKICLHLITIVMYLHGSTIFTWRFYRDPSATNNLNSQPRVI